MCPEELTNESARVLAGSSRESEEADKDLVEIDRLDAVQNLLKYQEETRRWRNKKVSLKNIKVGDFVLKRKKNADAVGKFQFAWSQARFETGPFASKTRQVWSCHIRGMWTTCVSSSRNLLSVGAFCTEL
jgi:hypothetical protein